MPPEERIDDIKRDIEDLEHKVTNIWNIKKGGTKQPLNMFYIELKPENNKDIYQTTHVLGYRVNFEPPHVKREIPQCINCQRYGHTKDFCNRKARCIKCAEDHPTLSCPWKIKSENVKCVLCEGNHPANYKSCMIYKDLQKRHFPTLRKKEITTKSQSQVESARIQSKTVQPGRTYTSATRTESSSLTVSPIHRATQPRVVPSSPNQFIEEVMQEFQKEFKEFMDKTSQLINLA